MEDLDARLVIAGVEVSCWQDQLRQAVSIYISTKLFSSISILCIQYQSIFHFGSLQF